MIPAEDNPIPSEILKNINSIAMYGTDGSDYSIESAKKALTQMRENNYDFETGDETAERLANQHRARPWIIFGEDDSIIFLNNHFTLQNL